MTLKGFLLLLLTVSFTLCGQILMKKGIMQTQSLTVKSVLSNYLIITGGICYIASFAVWLSVLKILPLSIAYPSASISYVGIIIASAVFLNEPVTVAKIIGITLISAGVIFIGRAG